MEGFIDEIPKDLFRIIDQVGSGSYSDIFSAIHIPTNTKVALKITFKSNNEDELKSIRQEAEINKSLSHPFICQYFTSIETDHLFIIVMELIDGYDCLTYVNSRSGLPLPESKNLFSQIAIAIEYLHNDQHITHRDLKLENIMLDNFNHIRLIDFGFSTDNCMMSTCCGSIPYCAPEVLLGNKYTQAADIWSIGVILYAFIEGNLPFYHTNMNSLSHMICQHELSFSESFDKDSKDLLRKMLTKDPDQRITIDEIMKHPFISNEQILQINYKPIFQIFEYKDRSLANLSPSRSSQIYSNFDNLIIDNNLEVNSKNKRFPLLKNSPKKVTQSHSCVGNTKESLNDMILSRKNFPSYLNNVIKSAILNTQNLQKVATQKNQINSLHFHSIRTPALRRNPHRSMFKGSAPIFHPKIKNSNLINDI